MFKPEKRRFPESWRRNWKLWMPLAAALCVLLTWAPLNAAPFGLTDEEAQALVDQLEERFDVIATSRGYVLQDRDGALAVIEIEERRVVVDGEALDPETLSDLVGAEITQALLALSGDKEASVALADAERQAAERIEELRRELEELEQQRQEEAAEVEEARSETRRERGLRRTGTRFSFGSDLEIDANERARDVIVIFGDLEINGEVDKDVVVVMGSAKVSGRVEGQATVVGGSLRVGPDARIDRAVTVVGGTITDPNDRIDGITQEISFGPWGNFGDWGDFSWGGWGPSDEPPWYDVVSLSIRTGFLLLLMFLILLIANRRVTRVAERARLEPWKAGMVGILVEVLILPIGLIAALILFISVIGIPVLAVLLPLSLFAFAAILCLGYAGVAVALGNAASRRPAAATLPSFVALIVGLILIQSWQIVGEALTMVGGFFGFTAYLLVIGGFFLKYTVWTVGLGAIFLERFSPLEPAYPTGPPPILPDLEDTQVDQDIPPDLPPLPDPYKEEDEVYAAAGAPQESTDPGEEEAEDTATEETAQEDVAREDVAPKDVAPKNDA